MRNENEVPPPARDAAARMHRLVVTLLQVEMATDLVLPIRDGRGLTTVLVTSIRLITVAPPVL